MTSLPPQTRPLLGVALLLGGLCLAAILVRSLWIQGDQPVNMMEDAPHHLTGRVLSEEGQPLEGATLLAGTLTTKSDERGHFKLNRDILTAAAHAAADGTVLIDAIHPEYVRGGVGELGAMRLDLSENSAQDTESITLFMHQPARLRGRVTLNGAPVADASIGLAYTEARGLGQEPLLPHTLSDLARTDSQGQFALNNLAAGRVAVTVETDLPEFPYAESAALRLTPGEDGGEVHIELRPTTALTGVVFSASGDPLPASVTLSGTQTSRRAATSSTGSFRFDDLPPGDYTLSADAPDHYPDTLGPFTVETGTTASHDIVLEPARGLFGRVVGPDGQPQPGFVIASSANDTRRLRVGDDGLFNWESAPDMPWTLQATSSAYAPSARQSTRLGQPLTLELRPGGELAGVVVDKRGQPMASYQIAIAAMDVPPPHPYVPGRINTEQVETSTGRFRIGPLAPGYYALVARAPGLAPVTSELFEVRPGRTTDHIRLQLLEGASIAGVVRDHESKEPIATASVTLVDPSQRLAPRNAIANPSGYYGLSELPDGLVTLYVRANGYEPELVAGIELKSGGTLTYDIELTPTENPEPALAFYGIGASLRSQASDIVVVNVMPGSSSAEAGLQPGDRILAVDELPTHRLSLPDVIARIRGQADTPVSLSIARPGEGEFVVDIARRRVRVQR
ncbi:PDZ domain-containing protein [Lujinxingia sediminis]|uniref:PDZ domain-containing protein n=1 Tax=Lujinxingia sediminis TaxID=2480984 RepID=A0ABY0CR74_9DELT|nr:carboxypeptidase regulatory-like domain-containing protein [Lujinxingia sediminis]RVU43074.1 PDZ domain-containing protein [Lujinxingia sediminis]